MSSGSGGPRMAVGPPQAARPGTILCECGKPAVIRCHFCHRVTCGRDSLISCAFDPSHRWVPPVKEHGLGGAA